MKRNMRNRIRNRYVVLKNIIPYAYGVKRYWVMLVILGSGIAGADILIPKLYQLDKKANCLFSLTF